MADDFRTCVRAGCRWPAAASLSYRYATRQVWLGDLLEERDPNAWDLCPHHAGTMTVMRGWDLVDERVVVPAVIEPAAPDRIPRPVRTPQPVRTRAASLVPAGGGPGDRDPVTLRGPAAAPDEAPADRARPSDLPRPAPGHVRPLRPVRTVERGGRPNRYADLSAELPRLAAEVAATLPHEEAPGGHPHPADTPATDEPPHEPAPPPPPADARRTWDDREEERRLAAPAPAEAEGQLTLPRMVQESVVVPFLRPAPREPTTS